MIPGEETEFFRRVLSGDRLALYVPEAAVEHRIAPYRASWRYYLRWQRGYGRATVLMDPPESARHRRRELRAVLRELSSLAYLGVRRRLDKDRQAWLETRRESERCKGRLLQLLGL